MLGQKSDENDKAINNKPIDDNHEINTIETTKNQQIGTEKDKIEEPIPSALTTEQSAKTTTITTDTAPREKNDTTTDDSLLELDDENDQKPPVTGGEKKEKHKNIDDKEKGEVAPKSPTNINSNEIQNTGEVNTASRIEDNQHQHHKSSEFKNESECPAEGSGEKSTEDAPQQQQQEDTFDDTTVLPIPEEITTLHGKAHEVAPFFIDHETFAEKVPGSLQQEVGLLPRILERLQAGPEAFISDTTLFELYAIASILTRLDGCSLLKGTEIAKLVTAVKKLFAFNIRCACPALAEEDPGEGEQQEKGKEEKSDENNTAHRANDSHQQAQPAGHNTTHLEPPQNVCPRSHKQNQQQHPCGKKKGGGKHKNKKHKSKKQSQLSAALRNVNEAAMRNSKPGSKLASDEEKEEEENEVNVGTGAGEDCDNDENKKTCINNDNDDINAPAEKTKPVTESEPPKAQPSPRSKDALAINRLLAYFDEGWYAAQKKKRYLSVYNQLRSLTKDPQEMMRDIPTRTTGMRSENESNGEGIIHYTIYSLEESGYGEDETATRALHESEEKHRHLLKQLGGDDSRRNTKKTTTHPRVDQKVNNNTLGLGKRLAFLVGPRGASEEVGRESTNTHMAELSILAEILSSARYGFEVHTTLVSNDLCAEEVEDEMVDTISRTVEEAAEEDRDNGTYKSPYIDQILVYLFTPDAVKINPQTGMPLPQYSLSFSSYGGDNNNNNNINGSHQTSSPSLSHRSIVNAINAACVGGDIIHDENGHPAALTPCCVGHVLIVHDVGHSLQTLAATVALPPHEQSLEIGHHVALTLTEAAKSIANTSRMWLFDGLFTPLICEMLTVARDDAAETYDALGERKTEKDKRCICAEDFVNYATIALGYKDDNEEDIEEIELDSNSDKDNDKDNEGEKKDKTRAYLPAVGRSVISLDRTLSTPLL